MLKNLERKKMVGTRGGSEVPLLPEATRLANIAENERKVKALIELKRNEALGGNKNPTEKAGSSQQPKKRKKLNNCTSEVANGGRNLRSQSRLNHDVEDPNNESIEHGSDDIQANASDMTVHQKKKRGRGPTELKKIYDRDQPKQKVELNEHGQPVGTNGKTFANFIGILVRKELSVLTEDWRYMEPEAKFKLWNDIKSYFEVDEAAFDYFMAAAAKKWREFKSDLKEKFDATLTGEELMERRDGRIQKDDWVKLIDQWRKPESEAQKLGYYPGRDRKIVEVHTSNKTGALTPLAAPLVNKLQTEAALHPELEGNSIEEGDLYAHTFGEKEPRGRVRMLGLGPTPQSVVAPGTKAKLPTKLAMEMQLRRRVEHKVSTLKEHMQEMQRQINQMQHIVLSKGSHIVETPTPSPPNSISRPALSRIAPDDDDEEEEYEGHHDAVQEDEGLSIQKRIPSSHNVASTHVPPRSHAATPSVRQASQDQEESLVGRDVILYHLVRSDPLAKAMVISTNQDTIV